MGSVRFQPLSSLPPHNNQTYKVDYLFEHDGCKVYRFYDHSNYVYFTSCNGEAIVVKDSSSIRNKTVVTVNQQLLMELLVGGNTSGCCKN